MNHENTEAQAIDLFTVLCYVPTTKFSTSFILN